MTIADLLVRDRRWPDTCGPRGYAETAGDPREGGLLITLGRSPLDCSVHQGGKLVHMVHRVEVVADVDHVTEAKLYCYPSKVVVAGADAKQIDQDRHGCGGSLGDGKP